MAFEEPDEHDPVPSGPMHPDDRLWRHPSELAGGAASPVAWPPLEARRGPSRSLVAAALASAALAGAVAALGLMWASGPVTSSSAGVGSNPSGASFGGAARTRQIVEVVSPSLVLVQVTSARGDRAGTGLWLDEGGTVLVPSPLLRDAREVTVEDRDHGALPATLVATDRAGAVAVLRVARTGTTPPNPAGSDPEPGSVVHVVSVLGPATGTAGVVQAAEAGVVRTGCRAEVDGQVLHDAIELDRALPPGASGALAVDARGHAVAVVVDPEGPAGVAVAIPAGAALRSGRDLAADGAVRRAWLGVRATDVTPTAARLVTTPEGALVTRVQAGSPAAAAGLRGGDVIVGLAGEPVADASDLVRAIGRLDPGQAVEVRWTRQGRGQTARVTLGG